MQRLIGLFGTWLDSIDPGSHRRIKGLRLVTAYGLATALGSLPAISVSAPSAASPGALAASFALWASVSEARTTRAMSSRDLVLLCIVAAVAAATCVLVTGALSSYGVTSGEWFLLTGAFASAYLKRFGLLGAGIGSQIYIGELTAFSMKLSPHDLHAVAVAALISILAAVVPRLLSGPAEQPAALLSLPTAVIKGRFRPEFLMGLQAASAALFISILSTVFELSESAWAITAAVYVISGTAYGTFERVKRRIVGTIIGVPLALLFLSIAGHMAIVVWCVASIGMIIYAIALPERYDVACGAFAFTLLITLAVTGEHSDAVLLARLWETILGGVVGVVTAFVLFPLRLIEAHTE